jgi:hypothetical protein
MYKAGGKIMCINSDGRLAKAAGLTLGKVYTIQKVAENYKMVTLKGIDDIWFDFSRFEIAGKKAKI